MEKYIKPLRQEKAELKAGLKDDYGIPTRAFNARYGVYRLEKDAIKSEDDIMLDTVRELWDATPIGGGIDLEDLANRAAVKREEMRAEAAAGKSTEVDL